MTGMFEAFSDGYYLGRLYVEPHEGDRPVMHAGQHEQVNQQVYATGEGVERLDHPLVMKLDEHHFAVHGAEGVPTDTLGLPGPLLDDTLVEHPPALREVLLAKADRAVQLLDWFGLDDALAC
jgi:hypothetical protein